VTGQHRREEGLAVSIERIQTRERTSFGRLDELCEFLRRETGAQMNGE
jgi:hypothetical protein